MTGCDCTSPAGASAPFAVRSDEHLRADSLCMHHETEEPDDPCEPDTFDDDVLAEQVLAAFDHPPHIEEKYFVQWFDGDDWLVGYDHVTNTVAPGGPGVIIGSLLLCDLEAGTIFAHPKPHPVALQMIVHHLRSDEATRQFRHLRARLVSGRTLDATDVKWFHETIQLVLSRVAEAGFTGAS